MNPVNFPESNARFGPPSDLTEEQCKTIFAFMSEVTGGSVDGANMVVTAWKPTPEELEELNAGNPVFLSCLGGLPPHYLTTNFQNATNPA